MKAVQTVCSQYPEEDIYNMDETGLYWRRGISAGLATQSLPSVKKDKKRISIVLCTNCTGSDRLPMWLIRQAKLPRALRGVSIPALSGCWRANKKA